jgi:ATP-dependent RNA helicase DeaD
MPLVVHMGIPTQMESYIHRSGRTGRAGAKGTSLALVSFKESRILLAWARRGGLKLVWRAVPTQQEIKELRTRLLIEKIKLKEAPQLLESAQRMLEGREPASLVAALLSMVEGPEHDGFDVPDAPKQEYSSEKRPFKPRPGEKAGWTPGQKPTYASKGSGKPYDKSAKPVRPFVKKHDDSAPYKPKSPGDFPKKRRD